MRKFIKVCLVTGAVTLVAGIICLAVGVFMGVDLTNIKASIGENRWGDEFLEQFEERWQSKASSAAYFQDDREDGEEHKREAQVFRDIKALELDLTNEEITLQEYDGQDVRVEITGEEADGIEMKASGGTLKMEGDSFRFGARQVLVSIPSDRVLEKTELAMDAGAVYAQNLHTKELEVKLKAGSFETDGFLKADKAELEVGAGSIAVNQIETENLEVKCDIGEIYITAAGSNGDYNYHVKCDVGVVNIGEDTYDGFDKEKKIDNKASRDIKAECSAGQVTIDFMEE